ncbi:GNAT family N-acetyltransferase [Ruminococcaceae bacterium OttesenSCG-928-O06]|nr:GNAT family N-acetyltransferase [Ruminococcaceae bacterium OttesenSCG-928-O06]
MTIREATTADLGAVLALYAQLHGEDVPAPSEALSELWAAILADPNRHIVLVELERTVAGCCEVLVVPNLTHNQRPYALVENVVTDEGFRRRGCAAAALNFAGEIARMNNCYKLMLMTGARGPGNIELYETAGYNQQDKTAFVQWL